MLYVILLCNMLVKLCSCVYPNMVVWSSESASSWQRELAVQQTTQNPYTPYMCVFFWVWCDGHPSLMSHPLIFERVLFHSEKRIGVISSVSVVISLKKTRGDWELTTVAVILQVLQETV